MSHRKRGLQTKKNISYKLQRKSELTSSLGVYINSQFLSLKENNMAFKIISVISRCKGNNCEIILNKKLYHYNKYNGLRIIRLNLLNFLHYCNSKYRKN